MYQKNLKLNKKAIARLFESELTPLLDQLQQLQSTKVLRGNYDLKISRQDYFLEKQNEVSNVYLI